MKGCIVMAVRNILTIGEETLRKKSREVTVFDRRLHILLEDMAKTLENAHGIGLAAPQIGILKRVVVIFDSEKRIELVNPVIIETLGEQQAVEGCLSIPGKYGITRRPETVTVIALDRKGNEFTITGSGLLARAFCHEIDHLNGVLYIDNVIRILTEEELENT
jgi:peptide deformylase